jgi:hypothetical protein
MCAHLDLAHGAGHDALQDRPAVVVQQVDLVDDDQPHQLSVGAVACGGGTGGWGRGERGEQLGRGKKM